MEQARLDGRAEAHPHLALNGDAVELLRTMRHDLGDEAKGWSSRRPSCRANRSRTWGERGTEWWRLRACGGSRSTRCAIVSAQCWRTRALIFTIGKQLGHAQTKTTARYAHLSVGTRRKASDEFSELVKANGKQG